MTQKLQQTLGFADRQLLRNSYCNFCVSKSVHYSGEKKIFWTLCILTLDMINRGL